MGAENVMLRWVRATMLVLMLVPGCGRLRFDDRGDAPAPGGDSADGAGDGAALTYPELVKSDGPIAYWRLGDATTVALDEMGSYPGTYSGNFTALASGVTSDGDGAVRFNDTVTTTNMSVPDAPALRLPGSKTIEVWYKPNGNVGQGTWPNVLSKGMFTSGYLLYYYPPSDDVHYRENTATEVGATAVGMNPSEWNHVVFVYDITDHSNTLYVNNVAFAAGTHDWGTNTDTGLLAIGTIRMASEGTTSSVDEVALYDYPLSASRVDAHFRNARGLP